MSRHVSVRQPYPEAHKRISQKVNSLNRMMQHSTGKPLDKMRKMMQNMQARKSNTFETFDLKEFEANTQLIRKSVRFANLLNSLKMYNIKLEEKRQWDIVNYKLYQFYYSTLQICNTKTNAEVECYLTQVENWIQTYNQKRNLYIQSDKKKSIKKFEDDLVRQTFKSNLPLEIDQYKRKVCMLPSYKEQQKAISRKNSQDSDSEDDAMQRMIDEKKAEIQLPNLRCQRNQLLIMRKAFQEKQEANILAKLKKNQARILIQSSNNFYKGGRNRKDIYHFDERDDQQKRQDENMGKTQPDNWKQDKQNAKFRTIVNSTSIGFFQIKKKNMNMALGEKKSIGKNLPRFWTLEESFVNMDHGSGDNAAMVDISGMSLMNNPFEVTKGKKEKKAK